ncbi:MAG TPA: hypothetical protein DCQ26_07535 [Marinilabiliales bacterium]|nr:MAG: hypothetical protein A2W84_02825 [Bacteroidetes bacterium GWC2_40_13]OFX71885.1 MAG: hypothetical protein A2W96_06540 [Bacteroidetes bacterium GWD2_40_43]OFX94682.1 MAG: hypothetical protein A2W97_18345 [Bacteroidetes bacterium GWE2_40_63]OFY24789.1 MAG: hypothetical protein A2W88_16970 [Bacteroidetes bacterium GWF2_40_13]OFZ24448.1 MAG: hypothetical protein A2437_18480 [Bacteroidetes bacterium RIFOXYC2_FULL_40_12]HAM98449.1 hypothetical protein [Marinilabiliales bacterium]
MEIKFELNFENSEKELLKSILHCDTEAKLNDKLNKLSRSAFEEIRKMVIGQKVFTRGRDILEFRLFNLISYYFEGKIPDEQKICDLFQITATESRAIVRSIMSKYQYDLKETISSSLKEQVQNIIKDENLDFYRLSIQNQFFKDELNKILGNMDTSLPIIEKERGTISTYIIQPSSYENLCVYFNIEIEN